MSFSMTSSRIFLKRWCRYSDVVCGLLITLSIRCLLVSNEDGTFGERALCKSGHLVSIALNVKKNVGDPIWVIKLVNSVRRVFQNALVPRKVDQKCINSSAS